MYYIGWIKFLLTLYISRLSLWMLGKHLLEGLERLSVADKKYDSSWLKTCYQKKALQQLLSGLIKLR